MPTASCLCGAVQVRVDSIVGTGVCHCLACRKTTSSVYALNAIVPSSAFHLVCGSPKSYTITGSSGAIAESYFCGDCGSAMWKAHSSSPEFIGLKAGTLDGEDAFEEEKLKPFVEQYIKRRPPWLTAIDGARQYDEQVPRKEVDAQMKT